MYIDAQVRAELDDYFSLSINYFSFLKGQKVNEDYMKHMITFRMLFGKFKQKRMSPNN